MREDERLMGGRATQSTDGYMRERERTGAGTTTDHLLAGRWFTPQSAWAAVTVADPEADTELLDLTEPGDALPEDADTVGTGGPRAVFVPHGLEAGILTGLAKALDAGGMPSRAVTAHLADLAEIRGWLGEPLWQMTFWHADAYFGRQIGWREYPALLRQAQALARYFAYLAGPDGALVWERALAPVRCPLDALNWPTPDRRVRDADPPQEAEPDEWAESSAAASASAIAWDD